MSHDLRSMLPNVEGLSERNIRYCKTFYLLCSQADKILPQAVAKLGNNSSVVDKLCAVPWGHHRVIMDKCQGDVQKALFFVNKVVEDGWSRSVLMNFIDTNLYERQGAAATNFSMTIRPSVCLSVELKIVWWHSMHSNRAINL